MQNLKSVVFFFICFSIGLAPLRASGMVDHSLWDAFLQKYVNENGEVDYAAVKNDPSLLNGYLKSLEAQSSDPSSRTWPREEWIALWLNAYNAGVIKLVTENYPIRSIQQIPSASDITVVHVAKGQYSLNAIRREKLILTYRDEKIHFALACGAKSCPPLQRHAFTAANVEGQLFLVARSFLTDPRNVEVVPGKKTIKLSRILKWYEKDFRLDFGMQERIGKFTDDEMAILSFLAYYLEDENQIAYLEEGHYKIDYFSFDWDLNDWKRSPGLSLSESRELQSKNTPLEEPSSKA